MARYSRQPCSPLGRLSLLHSCSSVFWSRVRSPAQSRVERRRRMASISIRNVSKSYGHSPVLQELDLEIADGEFVSFLGPSGCGKSTLLYCIAGLEEITAGSIRLGDRDMGQVPPRDRNIALVFQDYALYPHMRV